MPLTTTRRADFPHPALQGGSHTLTAKSIEVDINFGAKHRITLDERPEPLVRL